MLANSSNISFVSDKRSSSFTKINCVCNSNADPSAIPKK